MGVDAHVNLVLGPGPDLLEQPHLRPGEQAAVAVRHLNSGGLDLRQPLVHLFQKRQGGAAGVPAAHGHVQPQALGVFPGVHHALDHLVLVQPEVVFHRPGVCRALDAHLVGAALLGQINVVLPPAAQRGEPGVEVLLRQGLHHLRVLLRGAGENLHAVDAQPVQRLAQGQLLVRLEHDVGGLLDLPKGAVVDAHALPGLHVLAGLFLPVQFGYFV